MVCFCHSIEQRKQIYSCKANSLGVAIINEQIAYVFTDGWLLTNCLHSKAAELYKS